MLQGIHFDRCAVRKGCLGGGWANHPVVRVVGRLYTQCNPLVAGVGGSVSQGKVDHVDVDVVVVLPTHHQLIGDEGLCAGGLFATIEFGGGGNDGGE